MERLFTGELLKVIGILGLGGISLMMLVGRLVGKIRGSFQPYIKPSVVYLLAVACLIAALGLLGYAPIFSRPVVSFIAYQLLFLAAGILHVYYLPKVVTWAAGDNVFLPKAIFTFVIAIIGFVLFIMVFKWINREGYHYIAGSSIAFFIIPLFVYQTFLQAIAMPPKIFKEWFYPVNTEVQDPDEDKLKNMLVISFEFQKNLNDKHFTNFRAKAPRDMEFGQLFYYFINDYNERHPNSKIAFGDDSNEAYGWIFYKKQRWYTVNTFYIDPEKTFYANRVRENDVIVCRRSLNI